MIQSFHVSNYIVAVAILVLVCSIYNNLHAAMEQPVLYNQMQTQIAKSNTQAQMEALIVRLQQEGLLSKYVENIKAKQMAAGQDFNNKLVLTKLARELAAQRTVLPAPKNIQFASEIKTTLSQLIGKVLHAPSWTDAIPVSSNNAVWLATMAAPPRI